MSYSREHMAMLGRRSQAKRTAAERERFARIGGLTARAAGVGHLWTAETAREAGRKGGRASGATRRKQP